MGAVVKNVLMCMYFLVMRVGAGVLKMSF